MNVEFFTAIKNRLNLVLPDLYVRLWRNQFAELENGDNYSFPFPCCFIEFISDNNIQTLGNGVQVLDPMTVRLHIGSFEPDNGFGTLDENTNIMTLKQQIFTTLQKWQSTKSGIFNRSFEIMHSEHEQVSVWIQDYKTILIDDTMREPVGGIIKNAPTNLSTYNDGNIVENAILFENGNEVFTENNNIIGSNNPLITE
jgi:hypothetical protein